MSKFTYKKINQIIEYTPQSLKGMQLIDISKKIRVGYFQKSMCNWIYEVYVIDFEGTLIEVVSTFGSII